MLRNRGRRGFERQLARSTLGGQSGNCPGPEVGLGEVISPLGIDSGRITGYSEVIREDNGGRQQLNAISELKNPIHRMECLV